MKKVIRGISFLLVCLMLAMSFAACGDQSKTTDSDNESKPLNSTEVLTGRDAEKDNVPADLNYGGEIVTFFTRVGNDLWLYELACEELKNDPLYDAIHYRNIDVENRLGVKIKTIAQPGAYADIQTWNQTLSTSVLTNTGDYDGAGVYASQSSPLAKDGIYLDLNTVSREFGTGYIELSRPWWNQTLVDELTTYGSLFFLSGDLMVSNVAMGYCLFFNKELFDEKFPSETSAALYDHVKKGSWTVDKLIEYVSAVWDDKNSNGIIDDGDVMGWCDLSSQGDSGMDVWMYSQGLSITKINASGDPEISILYDVNTVPAYENVQKLYYENPGSYGTSGLTTKCTETGMANGNLLFTRALLSSGAGMRDSEVVYGVLPVPKFDEAQETYRTIFGNTASFLVLCSNLDSDRAEMMSAVVEALAAESYKSVTPVYYETVLQGQYSKDQPDAEMYDRILKSFVVDFGYTYATASIAGVGSLFRDVSLSSDIQSKIDAKKTQAETALGALLEALYDISG